MFALQFDQLPGGALGRHLLTLYLRANVQHQDAAVDRVVDALWPHLDPHQRVPLNKPLAMLLCGPSGHGKTQLVEALVEGFFGKSALTNNRLFCKNNGGDIKDDLDTTQVFGAAPGLTASDHAARFAEWMANVSDNAANVANRGRAVTGIFFLDELDKAGRKTADGLFVPAPVLTSFLPVLDSGTWSPKGGTAPVTYSAPRTIYFFAGNYLEPELLNPDCQMNPHSLLQHINTDVLPRLCGGSSAASGRISYSLLYFGFTADAQFDIVQASAGRALWTGDRQQLLPVGQYTNHTMDDPPEWDATWELDFALHNFLRRAVAADPKRGVRDVNRFWEHVFNQLQQAPRGVLPDGVHVGAFRFCHRVGFRQPAERKNPYLLVALDSLISKDGVWDKEAKWRTLRICDIDFSTLSVLHAAPVDDRLPAWLTGDQRDQHIREVVPPFVLQAPQRCLYPLPLRPADGLLPQSVAIRLAGSSD